MKSTYKAKVGSRNVWVKDKIRSYLDKYKIVGVVDITGFPANQLQTLKGLLRDRAEVFIIRKKAARYLFKELESEGYTGITKLVDMFSGVCGLLFTNDNPFKIYKFVNQNKSPAPAKDGDVLPQDIVVPAGVTNIPQGPFIGELSAFRLKVGMQDQKIAIKEEAQIASKGDTVSAKLAEVLARLEIFPMEIGLIIKAVYEAGIIYEQDILNVSQEEYVDALKEASAASFALSIGLEHYVPENIQTFIGSAGRDALALASGIDYVSKDTCDMVLLKAYRQALAVSMQAGSEFVPEGAVAAAQAEATSSAPQNEEKKEAESSKEEESAGLGDLFG